MAEIKISSAGLKLDTVKQCIKHGLHTDVPVIERIRCLDVALGVLDDLRAETQALRDKYTEREEVRQRRKQPAEWQ